MTLEGKIILYTYPQNWTINEAQLQKHPEIEVIRWIQAMNGINEDVTSNEYISSDDEEIENLDQKKCSDDNPTTISTDKESSESSDEENDIPSTNNKFALLSL